MYCCAKLQNTEAAMMYIEEMRSLGITMDEYVMGYLGQTLKETSELDQYWDLLEREKIVCRFSCSGGTKKKQKNKQTTNNNNPQTPNAGILFSLLKVCDNNKDYMSALSVITRYPQACTEKLQLFFFQILNKSKATTAEKQKCDSQLQTSFGKSLADLASIVNRFVRETADATPEVVSEPIDMSPEEDDDTAGVVFDAGDEDSGVSF